MLRLMCVVAVMAVAARGWAAESVVLPIGDAKPSGKIVTEEIGGQSWVVNNGDGASRLNWKLPAAVSAGWYFVDFKGLSERNPVEWRNSVEIEPYRFFVSVSKQDELAAFSFVVPGSRDAELSSIRHPYLDVPLKVVQRRSDRPVMVKGGDVLKMVAKSQFSACGEVTLTPVAEGMRAQIETFGAEVPFHLFDQRQRPEFKLRVATLGEASFDGLLELRWADALGRDIAEPVRPIRLAAGEKRDIAVDAPGNMAFGAYTLHVVLKNSGGEVVTHQQRHLTYSPYCDPAKVPANSPFGFHIRPFEPAIPNVGFHHVRIFHEWRIMNPAPGQYDWTEMDAMVEKARAANCKVLWVMTGVPKWASSKPEEVKFQTYPPADWATVGTFLKAFWARYASEGKLDVVDSIEIWNEPNAPDWTHLTYDEYVRLGKEIFQATRAYAPQAKVVGISLCGGLDYKFIKNIMAAGIGPYMDVVSTHLYEINSPHGQTSIMTKVIAMRDGFKNVGLPEVPVWNTEAGIGSWGRWGEAVVPADEMVRRVTASPHYDPSIQRVKKRWLSFNEDVACAMMVRSAAQQIEMGVERMYYFKWQAGVFSWVHDWDDNGNVVPKLMVPVQAVQSELWRRYATSVAEPVKVVSSSNADATIYAHSFKGPKGRLWVVYAHPKEGGLVVGDETAGAMGAAGQNVAAGMRKVEKNLGGFGIASDVVLELPGVGRSVISTDMLARDVKRVEVKDGRVAMTARFGPVYLAETEDLWGE